MRRLPSWLPSRSSGGKGIVKKECHIDSTNLERQVEVHRVRPRVDKRIGRERSQRLMSCSSGLRKQRKEILQSQILMC